MVVPGGDLQQAQEQDQMTPPVNAGKDSDPLNVRILHSLEETINHSVQAVKDAVIGSDVEDLQRQEGTDEKIHPAAAEAESKGVLHSLEEKISHSVQAVKDAVIGGDVDGESQRSQARRDPEGNQQGDHEIVDGSKSLLQSMEETIVQSVQSVEETIAHSVQTVKEAVNAAAEAAGAPASGSSPGGSGEKMTDAAVVDEAAILVHSVVQD